MSPEKFRLPHILLSLLFLISTPSWSGDTMYFVGSMRSLRVCITTIDEHIKPDLNQVGIAFARAYFRWNIYLTQKGIRKAYDVIEIAQALNYPSFANLDEQALWSGFSKDFREKSLESMRIYLEDPFFNEKVLPHVKARRASSNFVPQMPTFDDLRSDPPVVLSLSLMCDNNYDLKVVVNENKNTGMLAELSELRHQDPDAPYDWHPATMQVYLDFSPKNAFYRKWADQGRRLSAISIHDNWGLEALFTHEIGHIFGIPHKADTIMSADVLREITSRTTNALHFNDIQRRRLFGLVDFIDHPRTLLLPNTSVSTVTGNYFGFRGFLESIWINRQLNRFHIFSNEGVDINWVDVNKTISKDLEDLEIAMKRPAFLKHANHGYYGTAVVRYGDIDDHYMEYFVNTGDIAQKGNGRIELNCFGSKLEIFNPDVSRGGYIGTLDPNYEITSDDGRRLMRRAAHYVACLDAIRGERKFSEAAVDEYEKAVYAPEKEMAAIKVNLKNIGDALEAKKVFLVKGSHPELINAENLRRYCSPIKLIRTVELCFIGFSSRNLLFYVQREGDFSMVEDLLILSESFKNGLRSDRLTLELEDEKGNPLFLEFLLRLDGGALDQGPAPDSISATLNPAQGSVYYGGDLQTKLNFKLSK